MQKLINHKSILLLALIFLLPSCQKSRNKAFLQNRYNNQIFFENHAFLKINTLANHQKALENLKTLENNPYSLNMQEVIDLLSVPNIYSKSGNSETWFFKNCDVIITWQLKNNTYEVNTVLNYQNERVEQNVLKCANKLY